MSDDRDKIKTIPVSERKNRSGKKGGSVISIAGQSALFTRRGDEKADAGDYLGALKMYRRALENCEKGSYEAADLALRISDTYLDMNSYADALAPIAPLLLPGHPQYRAACFRLGHILAGRGEFVAGKEAFWLSLASDDSDDSEPLNADDAANALDCIDFCDQYIDEDEQLYPTLRDADEVEIDRILTEAASHTDKGEFDQALPLLEDGFEKYPDSKPMFTDLLLAYFCEQRFYDGMVLYNSVSPQMRDDFTVQCCAAMIFSRLGLKQQEQECAERAMSFSVNDTQQLVRAYATMMELERFDNAFDYASKLYELEPYNRNFIHFCAHSAYRLGNTALAKSYYERSLAIEPYDSAAYYYKGVCEQTLEDGEIRTMQIDYAVPHAEFINRCKFTEKLAHLESDELHALWEHEPETILMMTDWAMTDRNCPYGDLYIVLMLLLDKDRAERILRRLLVEPDCSDGLRKLAAARLGSIRQDRKFCMFRDGGISVCSFADTVNYSQWPDSYRRIMELIYQELGESSPKLFAEAAKLCYRYAVHNYRERPRLPYGQPEAMAAAIIYFMTAKSPDEPPLDMNTFAAAHGITRRRLENALHRLFELPAPELVESILSRTEEAPVDDDPAEAPQPGKIFPLDGHKKDDDDDE